MIFEKKNVLLMIVFILKYYIFRDIWNKRFFLVIFDKNIWKSWNEKVRINSIFIIFYGYVINISRYIKISIMVKFESYVL